MSNLGNFNANEHENVLFSPIPKGEYPIIAIKSEIKENSNKTGSYIKVEFQVVNGPFQNRKLFKNFNWTTTRADENGRKAVQIGKGQFSAFCRAAGILTPTDTAQLHNIPVIGVVKITPAKGDYDEGNDITDFKSASGATTPASQPAAVPNATVAGPVAGRPWG